jgi:hypothetical protein
MRLTQPPLQQKIVDLNARQFARAAGIWAKTDGIDARVLCAFGQAICPRVLAVNDHWNIGSLKQMDQVIQAFRGFSVARAAAPKASKALKP